MASPAHDDVASLCSILASDRSCGESAAIQLPRPGSPECDEIFLAAWAAFRHVTTQWGHQIMSEKEGRPCRLDPMDAFVRGRDSIPAYLRWAETEAMIRAGEWEPLPDPQSTKCYPRRWISGGSR